MPGKFWIYCSSFKKTSVWYRSGRNQFCNRFTYSQENLFSCLALPFLLCHTLCLPGTIGKTYTSINVTNVRSRLHLMCKLMWCTGVVSKTALLTGNFFFSSSEFFFKATHRKSENYLNGRQTWKKNYQPYFYFLSLYLFSF